MKKPAGALFYARYKDLMYLLPAEQVKELMVAFCEYAFDDKNPDVSQELIPVWALVKSGIDEDYKQYNDRCEQNKENIKKRWANKTENPPAPVEEVQAEIIKCLKGIIEKIDVRNHTIKLDSSDTITVDRDLFNQLYKDEILKTGYAISIKLVNNKVKEILLD